LRSALALRADRFDLVVLAVEAEAGCSPEDGYVAMIRDGFDRLA